MTPVDEEAGVSGEIVLNEADFVKAWRHVPVFERLRGLARLWLLAFPVLLLGTLMSREPDARLGELWPAALPALLCVLLGVAFLVLGPGAWARRALQDLGRDRIGVRVDREGLSWESTQRQVKLAWSAIPRVVDAGDAFLVYTGSQALLLVPKRAFSASEQEALSRLLAGRVTPAVSANPARRLVVALVLVIVALNLWHYASLPGAR